MAKKTHRPASSEAPQTDVEAAKPGPAEPAPLPGEKLLEVLAERQMSQTELCQRAGRGSSTTAPSS